MRKTDQFLLPGIKPGSVEGRYDIYPCHRIADNCINAGFESLADELAGVSTIIIDGYGGVFFNNFRKKLEASLTAKGKRISWRNSYEFMKPSAAIEQLITPWTGEGDPLFGTLTDLSLQDLFSGKPFPSPDPEADINIVIGPGASLFGWKGTLLYIDLPKNEIQFRSRAGSITNLGADKPSDPKEMYKRFYFVDWIVLNRHKQSLLPAIDIIIDDQQPDNPSWMKGEDLRKSLAEMASTVFRVRPWFEPGTWGGSWIKDNIDGLNRNVPNYAWSFELITPENGLLLESSGRLLEISFDLLMYQEGESILGDCHARFGTDFPIRFDFLDTFDGGNLSVQCHPRAEYMKKNFGGSFTQEETYYILDTKDNAAVYLGFNEDIDRNAFRKVLEKSFDENIPADIEKYVQKHPAEKHELFLIPPGTIHGSGKNNLVLEISSTPYIFTFKMYDWLRPDLDGKPRPLNINRGMENLYFERKGAYVKEKLISHPVMIDKGPGWELWHMPTHESHLYDVHRFKIMDSVDVETSGKCHVLSLVEGSSILVETRNGGSQVFSYAETFVIPASAGKYRIVNRSPQQDALVVKAFVK
ncbi:MAG TPA: class I mannose-6-phosphate isomerase [Bacteroidales bacterium]|nr:class I mannose-6-phosphate isomerase [Bacteroidales bacterium]